MVKRYAERDIEALDDAGGFYISHVMAMTGESLHGKSQIAAELGFRDMKINELESQLAATKAELEALREQTRWRDVREELPPFTGCFGGFAYVSDDVIAYSASKGIISADYSSHGWGDENGDIPEDITHWMPLPSHPTT